MGTPSVASSKKRDARHVPPFIFGAEGGSSIPRNPKRVQLKTEYRERIGRGMIDPENFEYWHLLQCERANRLASRIYALCNKHDVRKFLTSFPDGYPEGSLEAIKILNIAYSRWIQSEAGEGTAGKKKMRKVFLAVFVPNIAAFFAELELVISRTQLSMRSCCTGTIRKKLFSEVLLAYRDRRICPKFKTDEFNGD